MFIPAGIPGEKAPTWRSGLSEKVVGKIGEVTGFFKNRFLGALNGRKTIETKNPTPTPSHKENQFIQGVVDQAKNIVSGTVLGVAALGAQGGAIPQTEPHFDDGFIQAPEAKKSDAFGDIPVKEMMKKETSTYLPISSLTETSVNIRKAELGIPYETSLFDTTGTFMRKIQKDTRILIDQEKPVTTLKNPKTGKNESYVSIKGIIHDDNGQVTIDTESCGYVLAPWLNGVVERKMNPETDKQIPQPSKIKPISFAGYLGPDGREIPEPIMRAVAVKYVGNILAPKIKKKIEEVEKEIIMNREFLKTEYLVNKKPIAEIGNYQRQIEVIKNKEKLATLNEAMESITISGQEALRNPTIISVLNSIKETSEWRGKIIEQASRIDRIRRTSYT